MSPNHFIIFGGRQSVFTRKRLITAFDKYGLPTAKDDEVILGLIQLTKEANNFTSPTGVTGGKLAISAIATHLPTENGIVGPVPGLLDFTSVVALISQKGHSGKSPEPLD